MTVLVADIGGTNCRLALAGSDASLSAVTRYQNDRFASFDAVLARFLAEQSQPGLDGCCIAVAGPVTASHARLTNRDWTIDAAAIAGTLVLPPGASVRLVNDLAALGHALPGLGPDRLAVVAEPAMSAVGNGQALVVGIGTGFNVCMVKTSETTSPVVIEAEMGHSSLPASVRAVLDQALGAAAAEEFATTEDVFSGRGLSRLYQIVSRGLALEGGQILAAFDTAQSGPVTETVEIAARALGRLARELVFLYLPFDGLHFAGGAARGILASRANEQFLQAFNRPGRFDDLIGRVPVRVITDDAAALIGVARIAGAQRPTA